MRDEKRDEAAPLGGDVCLGTSVIALVDPFGAGWVYRTCSGCAGCDRAAVAARMAPVLAGRDPFAGLPTFEIEEEW